MSGLKPFSLGPLFLVLCVTVFAQTRTSAPVSTQRVVEIRDNQLVVDGEKQPQLFGAEVQYFRLRGGYGPNVPRSEVLALWNKALDYFVQARMNAISFYIPWDFHEYAEGKFDFTGTADLDKDGRPDYPSRDLVTFFKLIAQHGITRIMVRPGPYINAEWGFLGFGAIPPWFHDKYPNSHMRTPFGLKTKLYDYHDPDLLRHSALWFKALYDQVLNEQIGPGKPVLFLQLDNETNFLWQSIYNHDYGPRAITRFQNFVKDIYKDIGKFNQTHGRQWDRWNQVQPPTYPDRNVGEDQDWYQFADQTISRFLARVRHFWAAAGVHEPEVLFTLAESYNAAQNGLLPHFVYRNERDVTGLMTVNLYPKTTEAPDRPLLNAPFKADLDVKSADEANDAYLGSRQEWVMGPEIQGGWWRGIEVSPASRQQTYLTVLGHGLKAFFVYYFNEGQNWGVEWAAQQIKPLYDQLRKERGLGSEPGQSLPEDFWHELQARSDRRIITGLDVRRILKEGAFQDKELYFDAPLDGHADPRAHYFHLKKIGERVVGPYQEFLARSVEAHDEVALVKDSTSHKPVDDPNLPSVQAAAEWTGGLLGYLMNVDVNPRILHGDLSPVSAFAEPKLIAHLDTGLNAPRTIEMLKKAIDRGQTLVNFLASNVPQQLGFNVSSRALFPRKAGGANIPLIFYVNGEGHLSSPAEPGATKMQLISSSPAYQYQLEANDKNCEGLLFWQKKVVGYRCRMGLATFIQLGALIFEDYNSNDYAKIPKPLEREIFFKAILDEASVKAKILLSENALQTVAFARQDPKKEILWLTVKTGSLKPREVSIRLSPELLIAGLNREPGATLYSVTDLLSQENRRITGTQLTQSGFHVNLPPNGSAVYVLRVLHP